MILVKSSKAPVCAHSFSQAVHAVRGDIVQRVVFEVVDVEVPEGRIVLVGLFDVHSVDLVVGGEHCFLVDGDEAVGGVFVGRRGDGGSDLSDVDVFFRIRLTISHAKVLIMRMTHHLKPHNMLIPFHQRLIPTTTLMLKVTRLNMPNNIGKAACLLNCSQLRLQPRHYSTRVAAFTKDPPVGRVFGLCVQSDDFGAGWGSRCPVKLVEIKGVVTKLVKLGSSLFTQPILPPLPNSVNNVVVTGCGEVFDIDGPRVVVPETGIDLDLGVFEGGFDHLCDEEGVVGYFFGGVGPGVVGRVVTRPEEEIRLNNVFDMVEHALECLLRQIALISTPLPSLQVLLCRIPSLRPAAHRSTITAHPVSTLSILGV